MPPDTTPKADPTASASLELRRHSGRNPRYRPIEHSESSVQKRARWSNVVTCLI